MKRMTLRIFGVLGLALGLSVAGLRADVIEQVLVKVNGEILTKTDVEQLQVSALRASNPNVTAADLQNDVALRKMLDEVTPRVIVNAIDELLLLIPPDGAEIGSGEVELVELDHARADQAIAEPQRRLLDLDNDDVGQNLPQFRRIEGGAQRNGILNAAPRLPIVVEAMDAGRIELGKVEPVDLVDHGSDGAAARWD